MERHYRLRISRLSGEERMKMAADSFESARAIVLASLKEGMNEQETRRQLLIRFYQEDIDQKQMNIFLKMLPKG
jgi:hypothetical protein